MFLCDKRSKLVYDIVMLSFLSVIHFGIQPWEDLQILVPVTVLPILGDLRLPRASLLLSLPRLDPLLSSQMLSQLRKHILREPEPVKQGTVLDRIQDNMVVRPCKYS